MTEPHCFGCPHLFYTEGCYLTCMRYFKETGRVMYVAPNYYNPKFASPNKCPLRKQEVTE